MGLAGKTDQQEQHGESEIHIHKDGFDALVLGMDHRLSVDDGENGDG